jgi:hypothetical protein
MELATWEASNRGFGLVLGNVGVVPGALDDFWLPAETALVAATFTAIKRCEV